MSFTYGQAKHTVSEHTRSKHAQSKPAQHLLDLQDSPHSAHVGSNSGFTVKETDMIKYGKKLILIYFLEFKNTFNVKNI